MAKHLLWLWWTAVFYFIAATELCSSEVGVDLFNKYVVKYFGGPADIVSDMYTRFTTGFGHLCST